MNLNDSLKLVNQKFQSKNIRKRKHSKTISSKEWFEMNQSDTPKGVLSMNQHEDHPTTYHGLEVAKLEFKFYYLAWNSHSSPSRPSHGPVINLVLDDVGSS